VTGFAVALSLMLVMAGAGILGLIWHQKTVSDLENLLHHNPDRDSLGRAIDAVVYPLYSDLNLQRPGAANRLKADLTGSLNNAFSEFHEFRDRAEHLAQTPDWFQQQGLVSAQLRSIERELGRIQLLSNRVFEDSTGAETVSLEARTQQVEQLRREAYARVTEIKRILNNDLMAFHDPQYVLTSLQSERRRSEQLLDLVLILIPIAVGIYAITILCGFRWISNPLRAVAKGASRIGNGDTAFRISQVSRWNDEFSDLTENVNRMADRFQQTEETLQAQVEERSRQLVRSERLAGVGFLAAGVAHEINNPLSAISIAAESVQHRLYDMLDPDDADATEVLDRLGMIRRESKRCGEITARILNFSRGNQTEMLQTDLTQLVQEVLAIILPMKQYQGHPIVFEHHSPVYAEANGPQIKQVLLNLIANALQASNEGGEVSVRLTEQVDWVIIEIEDHGSGMSEETISHLFEPFYTTKEPGKGTGLGLSITHRIIEDHCGTIDPVSNGPGAGSLFRVRLPKRQKRKEAA
jgi:signal transduction histidine kinase